MLRTQRFSLFSAFLTCIVALSACNNATAPAAQMPDAATLRAAPLLFVNYWATWCGPCRDEIPELNEFARQHADAVTVIAINFDGSSGEQLKQEINEMGIAFASIDLATGEQLGLEKPSVLPTTYVLQKGKVVRTLLGPQTMKQLQAILADG